MLQALVEQTGSLEPEDWKSSSSPGRSRRGPYNEGPTYVNPINHMADTCASVGAVIFDEEIGTASYDASAWSVGCMHNVLSIADAQDAHGQRGRHPEAIAAYQEATGRPSRSIETTGDRDTAGRPPAVSRFRPIV